MSVLSEALTNAEPLDSVVFIHDYVQLTFQEVRLSIQRTKGPGLRIGKSSA